MDDPMLVPRLAAEVKSHAIPDGCEDCDAYTPERGCICPRPTLDRDQLICALVKADLATDFNDHRMRNRTNIEAAMIAADVVMRMLDQEKDSGQDRR